MARKSRPEASRGRTEAAEVAAEPAGAPSATAVAAEAMRTGVVPLTTTSRGDASDHADDRLKAGDVESNARGNADVGDEAPGGSVATPDQDRVDDIGRALGVQEADSGELRTSSELLEERDRRRSRQDEPDPTTRG